MTAVAIVDKYPVLRSGLKSFLREHFGDQFTIESGDFETFQNLENIQDFGLIILGIGQGVVSNNVKHITRIKRLYPRSRLIVYDEASDIALVPSYLKAGANGYLRKADALTELSKCIKYAIRGENYISHFVKNGILDNYLGKGKSKRSRRGV